MEKDQARKRFFERRAFGKVLPLRRLFFATQIDDPEIRIEALATSAEAYVLKENTARELIPAIEAALNGHCPTHHPSAAEQYRFLVALVARQEGQTLHSRN